MALEFCLQFPEKFELIWYEFGWRFWYSAKFLKYVWTSSQFTCDHLSFGFSKLVSFISYWILQALCKEFDGFQNDWQLLWNPSNWMIFRVLLCCLFAPSQYSWMGHSRSQTTDSWWLYPKFSKVKIHIPIPNRKFCNILAFLKKKMAE